LTEIGKAFTHPGGDLSEENKYKKYLSKENKYNRIYITRDTDLNPILTESTFNKLIEIKAFLTTYTTRTSLFGNCKDSTPYEGVCENTKSFLYEALRDLTLIYPRKTVSVLSRSIPDIGNLSNQLSEKAKTHHKKGTKPSIVIRNVNKEYVII